MTAEEILKVRLPESIFPNDLAGAKSKFRELAKLFHPDVNPGSESAANAFKHVNDLYKVAVFRIENGGWGKTGFTQLKTSYGETYAFDCLSKSDFELGEMIVGSEHVTYLVLPKYKDLFANASGKVMKFKYASPGMQKEFSRYLPSTGKVFALDDERLCMVISKPKDLLLLRDVFNHYNQKMNSKHVAWIISTLLNMCCYLNYADIVHQNISLDTYFICPEQHSGALLGGWWYAKRISEKVKYVPIRTANLMPWEAKTEKRADTQTDLELVRAVGRELFGKSRGKEVPDPFTEWIEGIAGTDPYKEYKAWPDVLKKSFGPRKFEKMDLNEGKLYHL